TMDDMALASVKAYGNANLNPLAHMYTVSMSLDRARTADARNPNFLANEALTQWLRVSDCSQVSDGASALILASEVGLEKLGCRPDECLDILACEVAPLSMAEDGHPLRLESVETASKRAYERAGIKASDIDIAEVHDCFTIAELLAYEALGFIEPGRGFSLLREGTTARHGSCPVNPGGGLVGFGHPVGATGVKQLVELWRQATHQCGDYQVNSDLRYGLAANMGGDDRTAVVTLCRAG
ncbi:MAG: thiolase domain-containing protein, partial [Pseudomonadota bacterium]|nr:thiolase domain-containing protein [Pseudomonadota bacterium]